MTPEKRCTKCGEVFPATREYFYANKTGKGGLASWCRDCHKLHMAKYMKEYQKNPKRIAYEASRQHSPKRIAYRKAYEQKPSVRKRRSDYGKSYRLNGDVREQIRLYSQNRRNKLVGTVTHADIELQFKSQKGKCWHCGKKLIDGKYHIDHLWPLDKQGKHDPRNIVISCPHCNLSKGAKPCYEWNGRLF